MNKKRQLKFIRETSLSYRKRRVNTNAPVDEPLTDPGKVFALFSDTQNESKEKLVAISLDVKQKIISYEVVGLGSVHALVVNPFELFRSSIVVNAAGLILVHNHPSGDPSPSESDRRMTKLVADYGRDGGIKLIDHIIIGDGRYFSFSAGNIVTFTQFGEQ